jgi:hypothetical protein
MFNESLAGVIASKAKSNPEQECAASGLLRCARNDGRARFHPEGSAGVELAMTAFGHRSKLLYI